MREGLDAPTILVTQHGYVSLAVASQMLGRPMATLKAWIDNDDVASTFHDDVWWVQLREVAAFSKHATR
jgi:hypothetical protein